MHKIKIMEHPVKIKFTINGLLALHAKHYTTLSTLSLLSIAWFGELEIWDTKWELNSLKWSSSLDL